MMEYHRPDVLTVATKRTLPSQCPNDIYFSNQTKGCFCRHIMYQSKRCSKCRIQKPTSEFNQDRSKCDGLRAYCRSCCRVYRRAYYARNSARIKAQQKERYQGYLPHYHYKAKYGISLDDYKALFESQGGKCAICRKPQGKRSLGVDHDHATGRVRGLLCDKCNLGLGYFDDEPDRLLAARFYLSL